MQTSIKIFPLAHSSKLSGMKFFDQIENIYSPCSEINILSVTDVQLVAKFCQILLT